MTKRAWGTEGPAQSGGRLSDPEYSVAGDFSTRNSFDRFAAISRICPLDSSVILVMVRATFSRLDKPRLEFELRSASCRPPSDYRDTPLTPSCMAHQEFVTSGTIAISIVN